MVLVYSTFDCCYSDPFRCKLVVGNNSTCKTEECRQGERIFPVIYLVFACFCFLIIIIVCRCAHGEPLIYTAIFTNSEEFEEQEMYGTRRNVVDANVFPSGIWKSRYYQYRKWHGPYKMFLRFDSRSTKIKGWGSDDVGKFTVKGFSSHKTNRICLRKTYVASTGNKAHNSGHNVDIELRENAHSQRFEGRWYVQTSKYHGQDKFEFKFNRTDECDECTKTNCAIDLYESLYQSNLY